MLDMLYVNSKVTLLRINVKHYKSNDWLARLTWRRKRENGRNKSCVNGLLERCLIYFVFRGPLAGHSHQLSLEISYPGNTYSKANDFCMALPYPLLGKATEKLKRFDGSQFTVYWKRHANLRWKINNSWLGFILENPTWSCPIQTQPIHPLSCLKPEKTSFSLLLLSLCMGAYIVSFRCLPLCKCLARASSQIIAHFGDES